MNTNTTIGVLDPQTSGRTSRLLCIALARFLEGCGEDEKQFAAYVTGIKTGAAAILHACGVDVLTDPTWKPILGAEQDLYEFVTTIKTMAEAYTAEEDAQRQPLN